SGNGLFSAHFFLSERRKDHRGGTPMLHAALPSVALQNFQSRVHGRLICKGDRDYDQARRVWNGRIDKYPAVIVRCADVVDVVTAVAFAREHHLLVAVRSGGHSLSGSSV